MPCTVIFTIDGQIALQDSICDNLRPYLFRNWKEFEQFIAYREYLNDKKIKEYSRCSDTSAVSVWHEALNEGHDLEDVYKKYKQPYFGYDDFKNLPKSHQQLLQEIYGFYPETIKNPSLLYRFTTAINNNNLEEVKKLFNQGLTHDKFEENDYTPLTLILDTKYSDSKIIEWLIEDGAKLHLKSFGVTPLMIACDRLCDGDIKIVKMILDKYKDNIDDEYEGETALKIAEKRYDKSFYNLLIEYGALTNKDEQLIRLVKNGDVDGVKKLLNKDASPNYIDSEGKNALSYAFEGKNLELIYELTKAGSIKLL